MGIGALRRHYDDEAIESTDVVLDRPSSGDKKALWVAYANQIGVDSTGSKDDIVERVLAHESAPDAAESDDLGEVDAQSVDIDEIVAQIVSGDGSDD